MCVSVVISFIWSKELFGILVIRRENERQSFGDGKEGKATEWKLFHREERPARGRNVIDTSERTCPDHRYVMGQHFCVL
jgi:hypothetical protein